MHQRIIIFRHNRRRRIYFGQVSLIVGNGVLGFGMKNAYGNCVVVFVMFIRKVIQNRQENLNQNNITSRQYYIVSRLRNKVLR